MADPTVDQVESWLKAMVDRRVAVVGDAMLDVYVCGSVIRISPEAPIPVLNVEREEILLGGAANVAKCLVALGAQVELCCVVGEDVDADVFFAEANNIGIGTENCVVDATRSTTRKTRVVARNQQVIRLDREVSTALSPSVAASMTQNVETAIKWADAVVLSDYSKGVLSDRLCRLAIDQFNGQPLLVDPNKLPWSRFRGATMIKPNQGEAEAFFGSSIQDATDASICASKIAQDLDIQNVLVTRGPAGMTLAAGESARQAQARSSTAVHFAGRPRDLVDVTGAGDLVAAMLILALAANVDVADAAWIANVAAGIQVGKFGAATVTGQEIVHCLAATSPECKSKLLSKRAVAEFASDLRSRGKKVAFTNGCFDLLHVGHVSYLQRSRSLADALIVGLNSDFSVRRLKGCGRPVQHEADRAHILSSLACVDAVVLFDEDTPLELIKSVRPDLLTKGADYEVPQNVVGWDVVQQWGGHVELVELIQGRSTTELLGKASGNSG